MSLIRTSEKPYKSLCSDIYVDSSNYLAELVCRRKQEKENAGALPIKFWNHPKYKNLYIREVSQAKNLLKIYPVQAILMALEDWKSKYIMSLRNKNLISIIESKLDLVKINEFTSSEVEELKKVQPVANKENIMRKI